MNKVSNIIKEKRTEKKYKKYAHKSFGPPSGAGQGERGTGKGVSIGIGLGNAFGWWFQDSFWPAGKIGSSTAQRERFTINPKLPKSYSGLRIDGIELKFVAVKFEAYKQIGKRKAAAKIEKSKRNELKELYV